MPGPSPQSTPIELGFVATHAGFVDSLLPNQTGHLPRTPADQLVIIDSIKEVLTLSKTPIHSVQISIFGGTHEEDLARLDQEVADLDLKFHPVLMLDGVNPIDPADENATVDQLLELITFAKSAKVTTLASTSLERWMTPLTSRRNGPALDEAIAQVAKIHSQVYQKADLQDSTITSWDLEFLRPAEFATFSDLSRLWLLVQACNSQISQNFFRCLIDTAHCADSGLPLPDQKSLIQDIASKDGLGMMHASCPTTRGCLTNDQSWIAPLLETAHATGKLTQVLVEIFHHQDPTLQPLRDAVPGHGTDTTQGKSYPQLVADGLAKVSQILSAR